MKQSAIGHRLCGRVLHLILLITAALVVGGGVQVGHAQPEPLPLPQRNTPPQHIRFDQLPFD